MKNRIVSLVLAGASLATLSMIFVACHTSPVGVTSRRASNEPSASTAPSSGPVNYTAAPEFDLESAMRNLGGRERVDEDLARLSGFREAARTEDPRQRDGGFAYAHMAPSADRPSKYGPFVASGTVAIDESTTPSNLNGLVGAVRANPGNIVKLGAVNEAAEPLAPTLVASSSNEELWVIQRHRPAPANRPQRDPNDPNDPGCGVMVTIPEGQPQGQSQQIPIPLKHTEVRASISAYISSVHVTQTFENPYSTKIEAVYVFPLPDNAAVSEFVMTIGDRHIRGIIREREEAERVYRQAKAAGMVASLLTQERPNIFTQKVANIEPCKKIDIEIDYYNTLAYSDGGYEFVFPMVVGPRFNPSYSGDGIGAVGPGAAGTSGQRTEVSYQRPNQRTGHDIGLTVDIDAGVSIESIACPTHAIDVQRTTGNKARVKLASRHEIPNKDFVLRYTVAGDAVKCALLTTRSQGTGYFTLMLVPPRNLERLERGPVEMVFVLDRSGSMNGKPIEQARAAIERGIRHMRPDDTFQIIDFAENVSKLGNRPISATDRNIREGLSYLSTLDASGGTYMLPGMKAALRFPHDDERLRVVAFLTDGFIGNEAENLTELDASLGHSRVFGFGVGSAPNRWLMNEMSAMGRGAVAYVGLDEPAADVMDDFFDRISHAALSDLNIDWGAAKVTDVYPSRLPDLFVGRPVIITGKFSGEFTSDIRIKGRAGGKATTVRIDPTDSNQIAEAQAALPKVWARMKITDLSRSALRRNPAECNATIRQTAIEYGLMSNFTAFVAVDSLEKTAGGYGTTVQVPVPIPEGTRYETAVSEGRERARVR